MITSRKPSAQIKRNNSRSCEMFETRLSHSSSASCPQSEACWVLNVTQNWFTAAKKPPGVFCQSLSSKDTFSVTARARLKHDAQLTHSKDGCDSSLRRFNAQKNHVSERAQTEMSWKSGSFVKSPSCRFKAKLRDAESVRVGPCDVNVVVC